MKMKIVTLIILYATCIASTVFVSLEKRFDFYLLFGIVVSAVMSMYCILYYTMLLECSENGRLFSKKAFLCLVPFVVAEYAAFPSNFIVTILVISIYTFVFSFLLIITIRTKEAEKTKYLQVRLTNLFCYYMIMVTLLIKSIFILPALSLFIVLILNTIEMFRLKGSIKIKQINSVLLVMVASFIASFFAVTIIRKVDMMGIEIMIFPLFILLFSIGLASLFEKPIRIKCKEDCFALFAGKADSDVE